MVQYRKRRKKRKTIVINMIFLLRSEAVLERKGSSLYRSPSHIKVRFRTRTITSIVKFFLKLNIYIKNIRLNREIVNKEAHKIMDGQSIKSRYSVAIKLDLEKMIYEKLKTFKYKYIYKNIAIPTDQRTK